MKGKNTIVMCQSEMQAAIHHYLATILMKPDVAAGVEVVKVASTSKDNVYDSFEIEICEKKVEVKP